MKRFDRSLQATKISFSLLNVKVKPLIFQKKNKNKLKIKCMDNLVQARSSSKTYNCTHSQWTPWSAMNNSPRAFFYHKENDGKE